MQDTKKGGYKTPKINTVKIVEDVITSSGENGGGSVVPPISNGGGYSGEDYN